MNIHISDLSKSLPLPYVNYAMEYFEQLLTQLTDVIVFEGKHNDTRRSFL